jgi:NMD protein affecting ribosome stability and mRNA decay
MEKCHDCGKEIPDFTFLCEDCSLELGFTQRPEEYGTCQLRGKLCHERGSCCVTGSFYKPSPKLNLKEYLAHGEKHRWELIDPEGPVHAYPNWQCPKFKRISTIKQPQLAVKLH